MREEAELTSTVLEYKLRYRKEGLLQIDRARINSKQKHGTYLQLLNTIFFLQINIILNQKLVLGDKLGWQI